MKILFLDETHPILYSIFEKKGWEVYVKNKASKEDLANELGIYDGIIIRSRFKLDADFLAKGNNLKFIGRPGAGLENIDTEYCKENNIQVFRSPEGNRDAVAEHALGMLLLLFNKLNFADTEVKNGVWDRIANRGEELMGKTVGIIGYGFMGEAFAKRLSGFGVNCIVYDKYKTNFSSDFVKEVTLETLYKEADVVSLHTPLTEENLGLINFDYLNNFKKNIYFINTARGQSVVLKDLVKHLKSGKVLGACLDVLEYEKTSFESIMENKNSETFTYLANANNVILTPHVAGWTHQSNEKMGRFLGEKIVSWFN